LKEEYINNIPLFAHLSSQERRAISKYFKLESYRSGEAIFVKDGDSDALYIVQDGWVSLSADAKITVANLGPGSLLGEADFFQGTPHTMTARANADIGVWVLDNDDFETLLKNYPQIGLNLSLAFGAPIIQTTNYLTGRLTEVSSMQNLSAEERSLIASQLAARRFEKDEAIFRSNDPVTGLFLIEGGMVRLIGDTNDDYAELGPGEIFGEMAVLSGKRHASTALVAQETITWQLSPERFEALTQTYPEIRTTLSRTLTARLSQADQAEAVDVLKQIPLFSELPQEGLEDTAARLILRHIPAGQAIFNIGNPGDALYIVDSGQVDITSEQGELVARSGEKDYFGEMALLTGKSRTFAAVATKHSNLWALYRPDFDALLVRYPQMSVALSKILKERLSTAEGHFVEKHLKKLAMMGGLSRMQLDDISSRLRAKRYRAGEIIYQEGQPGQELYFIENGHVQRFTATPAGYIPLPIMETGDFFGETSLLSGRPHSATARAQTDTDVWVLGKSDFDDLVYKYPNLSATLNRIMSNRLVETMEILRGGQGQAGPTAWPNAGQSYAQSQHAAQKGPPVALYPVNPPRPPGSRPVPPGSRPSRPGTGQVRRQSTGARQISAQARPQSRPASRQANRQSRPSSRVRPPVQRSYGSARSQRAVSRNIARGASRVGSNFRAYVDDLSAWFANIPVGTRFGLFILFLLIVWICGIVGPFSIIEALAATLKINQTQLESASASSSDTIADGFSQSGLVAILPFVETTTPTPTTTQMPTQTPTPSATVTQTPIPTFTYTPTSTPTPVDTPTPTPTPTETPTPTVTPTRTPSVPTNTPTPLPTPTPDVDFRVVKVRKLTPCENEGKHHIFVHVIDANGIGLNNVPVKISWGPNSGDSIIAKTEMKDEGAGYIEYAMFKGTYSVSVAGAKTEVASGITPDFQRDEVCEETGNSVANSLFHASFEVIFQRTY
jgi:CRP-like cAMP-binding protein